MRALLASMAFLLLFVAGCANRPLGEQACNCTLEYRPVCGEDGKTYGNVCQAACAKVATAYQGECKSCSESDGGKDASVKGSATDNSGEYADSCSDNVTVLESFCQNQTAVSEAVACPSGEICDDGACVPEPPPQITCAEYCPGQPHPGCAGEWNISGTYPDCVCGFVCEEGPGPEPGANLTKSTVFLFSSLKPLPLGHYELWAESGGSLSSIATFESGANLKLETPLDLTGAERILVTIEPEGDTDAAPGVTYLAGTVGEGKANLTFGADFMGVNGSYVLMNATGPGSNDRTNGVWFMSHTEPREATLKLPALPEGWVYEGWVLYKGVYLSTGRFVSAYGNDRSSYYSGPGEAPKFPGEDFIANAPAGVPFPANLDDGSTKIVVSVEPELDGTDPTGPEPFVIRILGAEIEDDFRSGLAYQLKRDSLSSPPSGDVQVSITLGDKVACVEYCPEQPHEDCIGSWNITGDYTPGCTCQFKCRDRPSD